MATTAPRNTNPHRASEFTRLVLGATLLTLCASCALDDTSADETLVARSSAVDVNVDDAVQGTGLNQFNYSATAWTHCASCNEAPPATYFQATQSWSSTTNATVSMAFQGTGVKYYAVTAPSHGVAALSIDGAAEAMVDLYSATKTGNVLAWTSPALAAGNHTLKIRVTGTKNASSSGTVITLDRASVVPVSSLDVDDSAVGSGQDQFQYVGTGWAHCASCNEPMVTYFQGTQSWSPTKDDSVTLAFTGTQAKYYAVTAPWHGVAAVSVDGGPETAVDLYSAAKTGNALVWTSPALTAATHTLKIRVKGTKSTSSTGYVVTLDRVNVTPSTSVSPPTGVVRDAQPGQANAVIDQSAVGDTVRLVGGVHPKLALTKDFSGGQVKITTTSGSYVKGVDTNGRDGYLFEDFESKIIASDVSNKADYNVAAFYVSGTSEDITINRAKLSGGYLALKVYCAAPSFAQRIKLIDSELWGAWGDLIHVDGVDDMLVEHNYLHDPITGLNDEHHDAYQIQRGNNWRLLRNTMKWDTIPKAWGPNQGIMVNGDSAPVTNAVIANNLIAHWHGGRPIILAGCNGVQIVNNTLVDSGDDISVTLDPGAGPNLNVEIWNNILDTAYHAGSTPSFFDTNWFRLGGNYQGTHAHTGDPKFVDSIAYELTATSPARGVGLTRAGTPTVDLDGNARTSPPALGARE